MVVVHDAELLSKADNSTRTTALQLVLQSLKKILTGGSATGRGATNIPSENLTGELTIVQGATLVLVIDVKEGIQVLFERNKNYSENYQF